MKLRKSLAAVATALAVATAGTTAAVAQEGSSLSSSNVPTSPDDKTAADQENGGEEGNENNSAKKETDTENTGNGSSIKDASPDDIKAWISVFTAVVTALGTLFAFVQKYL
ncbi:hypothetical protein [Corynebacterium pilosum]|uniref:Secreted protein n=1 Tax=Corynebacterium pilosum TaxID=35756 RepID=A0A376CQL2_9CORY|nr:hypothetical protein [Corynebacterium pilosum]STC70562.1 Uncharacterised protein [Corynebacterium pilosum]